MSMTLRVLIVDDEPMIRENLMAYLEDEGMDVEAAASAEAALDAIAGGERYAVCIMDMRLPGMDGNAAIRALHRLDPDLRFLIHTGSSDYSLPADLRELGLDARQVFHKPLNDMGPLAAAVRALAPRARP